MLNEHVLSSTTQIAFDTTNSELRDALKDAREGHEGGMAEMRQKIVSANVVSGDEFEKLTKIYRQMFSYLMFSYRDVFDAAKRDIGEREVAAAMESVFPRVTLKSFVTIRTEEKRTQLSELKNIVLGILLFNRSVGKGGAFLYDLPRLVAEECAALADELTECSRQCRIDCDKYVAVLHFLHGKGGSKVTVSKDSVARWRRELTNRRQLGAYAESLLNDLRRASENIDASVSVLQGEMASLRDAVGSKSSVPKEVVYPKFDIVAQHWMRLSRERAEIEVANETWHATRPFVASLRCTLSVKILHMAEKTTLSSSLTSSRVERDTKRSSLDEERGDTATISTDQPISEMETDAETVDETVAMSGEATSCDGETTLITDRDTPEIFSLPIAFAGYCSVTLVERSGLLLKGRVDLGLVRYRNRYYAFENLVSIRQFRASPQKYIDAVRTIAQRQTELVGMLDLVKMFPNLSGLHTRPSRSRGEDRTRSTHPLNAPTKTTTRDVGTGTPLHFKEKHIDYNYTWNEWSLRRKALQMANIRKSKTTSSQTLSSHFRQNIDTQVYLPRQTGTQTGLNKGTNPIRSHNYIVGLRGQSGTSKFIRRRKGDALKSAGACVVNLSFEL